MMISNLRRHDYAVLTFLVLFSHPDPSDLPDRSLDVMSAVTPCHVPSTVTGDVPSTLTCYKCPHRVLTTINVNRSTQEGIEVAQNWR